MGQEFRYEQKGTGETTLWLRAWGHGERFETLGSAGVKLKDGGVHPPNMTVYPEPYDIALQVRALCGALAHHGGQQAGPGWADAPRWSGGGGGGQMWPPFLTFSLSEGATAVGNHGPHRAGKMGILQNSNSLCGGR